MRNTEARNLLKGPVSCFLSRKVRPLCRSCFRVSRLWRTNPDPCLRRVLRAYRRRVCGLRIGGLLQITMEKTLRKETSGSGEGESEAPRVEYRGLWCMMAVNEETREWSRTRGTPDPGGVGVETQEKKSVSRSVYSSLSFTECTYLLVTQTSSHIVSVKPSVGPLLKTQNITVRSLRPDVRNRSFQTPSPTVPVWTRHRP